MNEPMTQDDAVKLDSEIRSTFAAIWDNLDHLTVLIERVIDGQAHVALGYRSTTAYLKDVLAGQPALGSKKDRDRRAQVIALLRSAGRMTNKDIAYTLGIDERTVRRETAIADSDQPDTIVSADGKKRPATYKKRQPAIEITEETDDFIEGEIVDEDPIFYEIPDDEVEPKTALDHQQDTARLTMKLDNAKRVLLDALKITQDLYQYDRTIKAVIDGYVPTLRDILVSIEATAVGTDIERGLAELLATEEN